MQHHDDRSTLLDGEHANDGHDGLGEVGVEARGGLVDEHDGGIDESDGGQRQSLPFSTR